MRRCAKYLLARATMRGRIKGITTWATAEQAGGGFACRSGCNDWRYRDGDGRGGQRFASSPLHVHGAGPRTNDAADASPPTPEAIHSEEIPVAWPAADRRAKTAGRRICGDERTFSDRRALRRRRILGYEGLAEGIVHRGLPISHTERNTSPSATSTPVGTTKESNP